MIAVIFAIILALVITLVHLERRFHFLGYLFFCRYPLLIALTLAIFLLVAMVWLAEDMWATSPTCVPETSFLSPS